MRKILPKLTLLLISLLFITGIVRAENTIIRMTTSAPAGTELRIYSTPFLAATITGADKSDYFGIYISKGPGTEITIKGTVQELEIYDCQLTSLELDSVADLKILKCYKNNISSLDVSKATALQVLDCHANKLTKLDLSNDTALEEANVSDNQLSTLTLGTLSSLNKLYCGHNALSSLDVSGCAALADLQAEDNDLTALDLSKNTKLWWIHIFGNKFDGEAVSNFISQLNTPAQTPGMLYLFDSTDSTEANRFSAKDISQLQAKGWSTCDYEGGAQNSSMTGSFYYGYDYVPTVSSQTISFTTTRKVGETVKLSIEASDDITIDGVAETTYTGSGKTFTLTSQTVTIKGNVTDFTCSSNDITSLTISENSKLSALDCSDNAIGSLDVIGATSMTQLHAQKNRLTHLDISGCTGLYRVDCYINQLSGDNMRSFMNSLCDGTANSPYLFVIDTKAAEGAEGNVATKSDVAIATGKNWQVFDYVNGDRWGMGQSYAGSDEGKPSKPEQYFTLTKPTKDYMMFSVTFSDKNYTPTVEGAVLSGWNGESMTLKFGDSDTARVYGDAVTIKALYSQLSAIDVSHLPNLTELNVGLNDLETLDVSKNSKLVTLSCEMNLLTTLDLSGCPELNYLNCYGNQIKKDNMTAMVTSLPQRDFSHFGELIVVDTDYEKEGNECLASDISIAQNKLWITYDLHSSGDMQTYAGYTDGIKAISANGQQQGYDAKNGVVYGAGHPVVVYDLKGRLLVTSKSGRLELSTLPSGQYIVRIGKKSMKIAK